MTLCVMHSCAHTFEAVQVGAGVELLHFGAQNAALGHDVCQLLALAHGVEAVGARAYALENLQVACGQLVCGDEDGGALWELVEVDVRVEFLDVIDLEAW